MTKTPTFEEFDKSRTEDYPAPKYIVKPAKDDKGFAIVKQAFDDQKPFFKPGMKSSNQDLEDTF